MDTGDHVIVVNAKGVRVTGGKEEKKIYVHHSGYPGGLNKVAYSRMMSRRPVQVVEKAIRGMLPKNRLGRQMASKLAVYEGSEHPHQAQKPVPLPLGDIPKWEGLPKPQARPQPAPATKSPGQTEGSSGRRGRTGTAKPATGSRTRKAAAKAPSARRAAASTGTSSRRKPQTSRKTEAVSSKASARSSTGRGAKGKAGAGEEKATPRRRSRKKTEKES
jgi:hypothetical protein